MNGPVTSSIKRRPDPSNGSNQHTRLKAQMLNEGDTLPWNLYSPSGAMLLSQGCTIKSERQIAQLVARGAEIHDDLSETSVGTAAVAKCGTATEPLASEPAVSFMLIQSFLGRLERAFKKLDKERPKGFATEILRLSMDIQAASNENVEAMIGSMLLTLDAPSHIEKPLHNAIICDACAKKAAMDPIERATLVAAALTSDIGMREIQHALFEQTAPLSSEQKAIVSTHPSRSCELLQAAGVEDKRWLESIEQHHERVDGTGYPKGLICDAICDHAKLITIADTYTALVRPRADQRSILYQDILRSILEQRGKAIDAKLVNLFINAVGLWAPGTMVLTMSGDIGIVTGHKGQLKEPTVLVVKAKDRPTPLAEPKSITVDGEQHKIACLLSPQDHSELLSSLGTIWSMRHPMANQFANIY